jgi:hypothetical protein
MGDMLRLLTAWTAKPHEPTALVVHAEVLLNLRLSNQRTIQYPARLQTAIFPMIASTLTSGGYPSGARISSGRN